MTPEEVVAYLQEALDARAEFYDRAAATSSVDTSAYRVRAERFRMISKSAVACRLWITDVEGNTKTVVHGTVKVPG